MAHRGVWLALLGVVTAQTTTGSSANPTISASAVFNGSTAPTPTAPVLQLNLNLEDVWDLLIGPVEVAETTTVYEPSPVPSSSLIPPPPIYYSPFPTGQQVPLVPKNESWAFPEHFWYVSDAFARFHYSDIHQVGSRWCGIPDRRCRERRRSRPKCLGCLVPCD